MDATDDDEAVIERARREMVAADARIEDGGEGSLIVRLVEPITVAGAQLTRITVDRVRVRHVRACRDAPSSSEAYADALITPSGAFDELGSDLDYTAVLRAVERQLGNFREGGRPSSQS